MICSIEKDANCGEGGGEEPAARAAAVLGARLLCWAFGLWPLARERRVRRVRRRLDVAVARVAAAYADLGNNIQLSLRGWVLAKEMLHINIYV